MFVELVRIESLSNNSYVVGSEQSGRCIVIDPARDIDRYVQIAANHGTRIVYAFRSEEHTSELQSRRNLVCRLLLERKKNTSGNLHIDCLKLA